MPEWLVRAVALLALVLLPCTPARAVEPVEVDKFGSNPGGLRMYAYLPAGLPSPAPLVVVLHGCLQTARNYARDAGWTGVADRLRFALLLPEQISTNNGNRCFNWFLPEDATRDRGEALSIRQMIDQMRTDHAIDDRRIYVTGLSGGGAMAAFLLAAYPHVFAGGGIIAGVPYGCARNLPEALGCMRWGAPVAASLLPAPICRSAPWLCPAPPTFTPEEWGARARAASGRDGPFPIVSIWQGSADTTVAPVNALELVEQWTSLHGLGPEPTRRGHLAGFSHLLYDDRAGRPVVEAVIITDMDHGTPIDPGSGPDQCGSPERYVLDVNLCSSLLIARFWGLAPAG